MEPTYQAATNITHNHVVQNIEQLTFPPYSKKIRTMPIQEPYAGVWALDGNLMIGIILAETNNRGTSELFSFYVRPKYRNQGIGNKLLTILEETLKKQGVRILRSRYWSDWKSVSVIEKMLKSHDWETPSVIRRILYTPVTTFKEMYWPKLVLPSDYEIFKWESLTNKDKEDISNMLNEGKIIEAFNPFQHEKQVFLPVSLGLRVNGKIAGWNLGYALKADTIEHNNLYILEEFRNKGIALKLLYDSIELQYELKIPNVAWIINEDNVMAKRVIGRLTLHNARKNIEVRSSQKIL